MTTTTTTKKITFNAQRVYQGRKWVEVFCDGKRVGLLVKWMSKTQSALHPNWMLFDALKQGNRINEAKELKDIKDCAITYFTK